MTHSDGAVAVACGGLSAAHEGLTEYGLPMPHGAPAHPDVLPDRPPPRRLSPAPPSTNALTKHECNSPSPPQARCAAGGV